MIGSCGEILIEECPQNGNNDYSERLLLNVLLRSELGFCSSSHGHGSKLDFSRDSRVVVVTEG